MLLSLLIGRKVHAVTFSSANMVDLLCNFIACVNDFCLSIDLVHIFASSYRDNKLIFVFHL